MRSIVLLLLLAIAPAAWCQTAGEAARSAVDLIDDCSDSATEDTIGLTDLESACPGLTSALEDSGYLPLLSTSERAALDVFDLSDLLLVDDWYQQQEARDVDVGTLGPILDSLRAEEPERAPGLLDRLQRWLRSLFGRQQTDPDNWLSRWLDELDVSDTVVRAILLVAIAVLRSSSSRQRSRSSWRCGLVIHGLLPARDTWPADRATAIGPGAAAP